MDRVRRWRLRIVLCPIIITGVGSPADRPCANRDAGPPT